MTGAGVLGVPLPTVGDKLFAAAVQRRGLFTNGRLEIEDVLLELGVRGGRGGSNAQRSAARGTRPILRRALDTDAAPSGCARVMGAGRGRCAPKETGAAAKHTPPSAARAYGCGLGRAATQSSSAGVNDRQSSVPPYPRPVLVPMPPRQNQPLQEFPRTAPLV